jgi:hypothetical protein
MQSEGKLYKVMKIRDIIPVLFNHNTDGISRICENGKNQREIIQFRQVKAASPPKKKKFLIFT